MLRTSLFFILMFCGAHVGRAIAPLPPAKAAAAKTLAWKLKAGQKIRVSTESEITRTTKIKATVDDTKIKTTIVQIWEVKEVSPEGVATIEQRPERLAITLEHRVDPKYVLDSEVLKSNPQLKGADRDAMRLLMEGSTTIKLDPQGVVRESSAPPDWLEKVKQSALAQYHEELTKAATPQCFEGVQLSLPAEAIDEGKEWRVESPRKEGKAAPYGEAKFIYRGEESVDGATLDRMEVEYSIKGLADSISITSQSNQAEFWFNSVEGLPTKLRATQSWKAEKPYRDNVILLTTSSSTTTTWKLIP